MCVVCGSGECEDELLICEFCEVSYHMTCLDPPLSSVPPGDWSCPTCVAEVDTCGEALTCMQPCTALNVWWRLLMLTCYFKTIISILRKEF